jgi:hypothetical protein
MTSSRRINQPPTHCRACVIVREQPLLKPRHLVHPVNGDAMLRPGHSAAHEKLERRASTVPDHLRF